MLHCVADGKGGQTIEDTGPLTKKRMETIDEEITAGALAWMEKQAKADRDCRTRLQRDHGCPAYCPCAFVTCSITWSRLKVPGF